MGGNFKRKVFMNIEKIKGYLEHKNSCETNQTIGGQAECTCGLEQLLAELEKEHKPTVKENLTFETIEDRHREILIGNNRNCDCDLTKLIDELGKEILMKDRWLSVHRGNEHKLEAERNALQFENERLNKKIKELNDIFCGD